MEERVVLPTTSPPISKTLHLEDYNKGELLQKSLSSKLSILTGFHAGYFRISLSLSAQSLLWKSLAITTANYPHALSPVILPSAAFILLWSLALLSLFILSIFYVARCFLRFPSVRSEFTHHIGVNYLFAPLISSLLLLQSSSFVSSNSSLYMLLCMIFLVPILILDVKIYGQWFTAKGKRLLSMVANPTSQLSVIGNLVGARAAARAGWRENALAMFSLGMTHYLVLFVTLYQRLQCGSGSALPPTLRPMYFLFFAAPSMASLAWSSINGYFDIPCKMLFFLSLFLFASLVSRPALFKKSMKRFNISWWAYSFPLTMLALAATEYAEQLKHGASNTLMLVLSVLSVLITLALILFSALNSSALLPREDPFLPSP